MKYFLSSLGALYAIIVAIIAFEVNNPGVGLLFLAGAALFVYDIYDKIKFKKFMKENLPKWNPKDDNTKPQ